MYRNDTFKNKRETVIKPFGSIATTFMHKLHSLEIIFRQIFSALRSCQEKNVNII
jgi:hypothetical protein